MTAYLRLSRRPLPLSHDTIKQWNRENVLANIMSEGSILMHIDWRYHELLHASRSLIIMVRVGIEDNRRTVSCYWNSQHIFS
jgi:HD superfamily phosphohydrolase YqeK